MASKNLADSGETTTMNLLNDVSISNANGQWRFKAGQNVKVPKFLADEVARIDYDHQQYKNNLNTKQKYIVNAGTLSVGTGAE
jgi:hypothetical protein